MAFAQLTYRESLRDIEACLRAQQAKLYHMGVRGRVSRSALADAAAYDDVIEMARGAKGDDEFGYRTEFINLVRLAKSASALSRN